jgi:bifunctional non-homologous end joining protein LigD
MLLTPVIPFEPISAEKIPAGERWIAQVKWDGVRVLTYYDGNEVRLFNRRRNERTVQYPEFLDIARYCSASSVILDGEIIALSGGKPSFHEVMRRDGIRKPENVERARRSIPVSYMIFDILYYNGKWITGLPLHQRQQILAETVTPQEDLQLVENFTNAEGLFNVIKAEDMEGIVCKDIDSRYIVGGKNDRWQKIKNYRDLTAVIGGATFRGNVVNAVLLGLYDETGRLWYVGHAGTGKLTANEWKDLTQRLKPLAALERPFVNKPERLKGILWVKPRITVKIKFIEWTERGTIRQPSIQAIVDEPPDRCLLPQPSS